MAGLSEVKPDSQGLVIRSDEVEVGGEVFNLEDVRSVQVGKSWPARFYWLSSLSGLMLSVVLWLGYFVMHSLAGDLTAGQPLESNGIIIAFLVIPAALYLASQNLHWIGFYAAFMFSFALFDFGASSIGVFARFFGDNPAILFGALGVCGVLLCGLVLFALDLATRPTSVLRVSGAFGSRLVAMGIGEDGAVRQVGKLSEVIEVEQGELSGT
ncbi:MAG: hypothetical protein ABIQ44_08550 [Chloroflexia bacterium]